MEQHPAASTTAPLPLEPTLYQVKKTIVGQDGLLERMLVALLARGHLLVEGVPGLAKTMAIKTLAQAIGGEFQRIQFTSDLVPADVVGTRIYNQREGEFQVSLGPVFTNLLLADEINRAPAKVQSALLEVMQERQVTIGRESYPAPDPFLVMATQNPIESEGTYPLPEAQLDRFMFKVLVGYPTATQEYVVVERMISARRDRRRRSSTPTPCSSYQRAADAVYVDPQIIEYAVRLSTATRDLAAAGLPELARYVSFGASPRASINMVLGAKALAFLRGRDYALPADARELARDVLRHRVVLSYEALADDVSPDDLLGPLLAADPAARDRAARARRRRPRGRHDRRRGTGHSGPDPGARAAPARVAGAAPPRRAAAGRLPDGVPRHRRRRRRPARVPVRRRPAPRRLERHRAHGRHARPGVPGGPRGHGLAAARRSASMDFGPVERRKHVVLTEVAATVAQLLSRGGNRVGALFFDTGVRETIPPGHGRNQVLRILARLLQTPGAGRPPAPGHHRPGGGAARRARDPAAPVARRDRLGLPQRAGLAGAAGPARPPARRGGRPGGGPARVRAPRGRDDLRRGRRDRRGRSSSTPTTPGFQRRLRAAADERQAALVADLRSAGLDLFTVSTDEDLVRALFRIAQLRRRRSAMTLSPGPGCCSASPPFRCWCCGTAGCCGAGGAARRAGRARPGRAGRGRRPGGGGTPPRRCSWSRWCCCSPRWPGPRRPCSQPRREGTVILAFDVSASMAADRPRPDPDGGREVRGARVRAAAAGDRAGRRRGVQRERAGHPGADHRPGRPCSPRSTGSRPQGGTALAQRPADLAERHRRAAGAGRRDRHAGRSSRRARTSATTARRRSSCSPTARTPTARTRSTSPRSPPARACGSTRSGSAGPRARCSRSTASRSRPRWTSRCCARSRPGPTAGTSRPPTSRRWPRSTTRSSWPGRCGPSTSR